MRAIIYAYGPANAATIDTYLNSALYKQLVLDTGAELTMFFGDLMDAEFDVVVAPGNSYAIMTGGFDQGLVDLFGQQLQDRIQHVIKTSHCGELNVGDAVFVKADPDKPVFCAYAPTMRTPKELPYNSDIPYMATRAALLATRKAAFIAPRILIPLMGVGTGMLDVKFVLSQIHRAVGSIVAPRIVSTLNDSQDMDYAILSRTF